MGRGSGEGGGERERNRILSSRDRNRFSFQFPSLRHSPSLLFSPSDIDFPGVGWNVRSVLWNVRPFHPHPTAPTPSSTTERERPVD